MQKVHHRSISKREQNRVLTGRKVFMFVPCPGRQSEYITRQPLVGLICDCRASMSFDGQIDRTIAVAVSLRLLAGFEALEETRHGWQRRTTSDRIHILKYGTVEWTGRVRPQTHQRLASILPSILEQRRISTGRALPGRQ